MVSYGVGFPIKEIKKILWLQTLKMEPDLAKGNAEKLSAHYVIFCLIGQ